MKTRPTPITHAAARKIEPTNRSKRNTAKAIANAALAWSLGKDGSCERFPQTCAERWSANGRARSQTWAMSWLISNASPDDASAEAHASFHFRLDPGRANSHRANVATARAGTAQFSTTLSPLPIHEWRTTNWLRAG